MARSRWIQTVLRLTAVLLAMFLVAGCGGGGESSTPDKPDDTDSAVSTTVSDTSTDDTTSATDATTTATDDDDTTTTKKDDDTDSRVDEDTEPSDDEDEFVTVTSSYNEAKWASKFPVKPAVSAEQSALLINNEKARDLQTAKVIPSQKGLVDAYDGKHGYRHHQGFTYFKGKYYASFSRGYESEDFPGQHAVVCSSEDGLTWSKPTVVGKPQLTRYRDNDGNYLFSAESIIINGYLMTNGNQLFFYYMESAPAAHMFVEEGLYSSPGDNIVNLWVKRYVCSTEDGVNWSEPAEIAFAANESPRKSLTGRYFQGTGSSLRYMDILDGFTFMTTGKPENHMEFAQQNGALMLTESSWYQLDNLIIRIIFRSNYRNGNFWMSESYDNGKSMTLPYKTNFIASQSMTNFGRLPDGRIYSVCTVDGDRWPLMLQISEDGNTFDKGYIVQSEKYTAKKGGLGKGGQYAYPEVFIHGEYMFICYSRCREIVEVSKIKLSDIK